MRALTAALFLILSLPNVSYAAYGCEEITITQSILGADRAAIIKAEFCPGADGVFRFVEPSSWAAVTGWGLFDLCTVEIARPGEATETHDCYAPGAYESLDPAEFTITDGAIIQSTMLAGLGDWWAHNFFIDYDETHGMLRIWWNGPSDDAGGVWPPANHYLTFRAWNAGSGDWRAPFDPAHSFGNFPYNVTNLMPTDIITGGGVVGHSGAGGWQGGDWPCKDDADSDLVCDSFDDNCTGVANRAQTDADFDGYGNLCDFDIDQSCMVGGGDLAKVYVHVLKTEPFATREEGASDVDDSGGVGGGDLAKVQANPMTRPGPSALSCADCTIVAPEVCD